MRRSDPSTQCDDCSDVQPNPLDAAMQSGFARGNPQCRLMKAVPQPRIHVL